MVDFLLIHFNKVLKSQISCGLINKLIFSSTVSFHAKKIVTKYKMQVRYFMISGHGTILHTDYDLELIENVPRCEIVTLAPVAASYYMCHEYFEPFRNRLSDIIRIENHGSFIHAVQQAEKETRGRIYNSAWANRFAKNQYDTSSVYSVQTDTIRNKCVNFDDEYDDTQLGLWDLNLNPSQKIILGEDQICETITGWFSLDRIIRLLLDMYPNDIIKIVDLTCNAIYEPDGYRNKITQKQIARVQRRHNRNMSRRKVHKDQDKEALLESSYSTVSGGKKTTQKRKRKIKQPRKKNKRRLL